MENIIKNIYKGWKTTLLSLVLFALDFYYLLEREEDKTIFIFIFLVAFLLLFAPDTFISGLKSLIKSNKTKKF